MNPSICLYFQVHQPYRLRDLRITEIGAMDHPDYFDEEKNRQVFRKVAEKCYLPANALLLELLEQYPHFSVAYSFSGVFLEQCKKYGPDVLASFQRLVKTGKVELMAETYHHSLSAVESLQEFSEQVALHVRTMQELFGVTPQVFRNTELIFSNEIAQYARLMGFQGILAEGADHILQGRTPNEPYVPPRFSLPDTYEQTIRSAFPTWEASKQIYVLLKNYRLSDDVAFRFSDKTWVGFPLTAERFTDWVLTSGGHCVNLFMDYETFGEHQWEDTGIFQFLRALPGIWERRGVEAHTPSQIIASWKQRNQSMQNNAVKHSMAFERFWKSVAPQKTINERTQEFDAHVPISWADTERDLSAWKGNRIQHAALQALYALEPLVRASKDPQLLDAWRRLQTSDHFYYMCTKYWNDGDVHKYFSPYDSPYEAYRRFSHAVCDLQEQLDQERRTKHNRSLKCETQKKGSTWFF